MADAFAHNHDQARSFPAGPSLESKSTDLPKELATASESLTKHLKATVNSVRRFYQDVSEFHPAKIYLISPKRLSRH